MRKYLFIVLAVLCFNIQAQDHLGTWVFDEFDKSAMDTVGVDQEELDAKLKMVSGLFSSMKLTFKEDNLYDLHLMVDKTDLPYELKDSYILIEKSDTIHLLSKDRARFSTGKMSFFLKKSDGEILKTYTYLTEETYENKKLNTSLLLGDWEVLEMRVREGVEGAEIISSVMSMITFNFTDTQLSLIAMGQSKGKDYRIDKSNNAILITEDEGIEKNPFFIRELSADHIILEEKDGEFLMYLGRL